MRVMYFGTYDPAYPRNAQVISALRGAGVEVLERHRTVWNPRARPRVGLRQLARIAGTERILAREAGGDADVLVVGYPGHFDLPAARRVAAGRPIVFNPLVSLYDAVVAERSRYRPGSFAAAIVDHADRRAFRRSHLVVADTAARAAFFAERFRLPPERLAVCLVGAEERLFRPLWQPPGRFHCLFVGKLTPAHGLETVLAAARIASSVTFRIVGDGSLEDLLGTVPANVEWVPWVDYESLPAAYAEAGCALGIFGTGDRPARVIPNRVFHALACGRPLITADTPAARELLTDGRDALLVPAGDAEALAATIEKVAADDALADRLAEAGRATYESHASEEVLGRRWRSLLERIVES
jgi:glycosyltransferase involved in cell wall biosynthesis